MASGRPDWNRGVTIHGKQDSNWLPIIVDASGALIAKMQGLYDSTLKTIAVDTSGKMIARIQGVDSDGLTLRDILVGDSGEIESKIVGVSSTFTVNCRLDDCGDEDAIANWVATYAPDPQDEVVYVKEGLHAMRLNLPRWSWNNQILRIWENTTDQGDLSSYQHDYIYMWVYVSSLTGWYNDPFSIQFEIGSDMYNRLLFDVMLADLVVGWNLFQFDLDNPDDTEGTVDWENIEYLHIEATMTPYIEVDKYIIIDDISFVSTSGTTTETKPLAIDTQGLLLTKLIADYGGVATLLKANSSGSLQVDLENSSNIAVDQSDNSDPWTTQLQGLSKTTVELYDVEDCGDSSDIENWLELTDGLNPEDETYYVKRGHHSMKLGVDADKHANDNASWMNITSVGDLSAYQNEWVYLWVYIDTLDYFAASGTVLLYKIGSSVGNYVGYNWAKSELSAGWNLLTCDLDNPDFSAGSVVWGAIDYQEISLNELTGNTTDFWLVINSIFFVSPQGDDDEITDIITDRDGRLKIDVYGEFNNRPTPIKANEYKSLYTDLSFPTGTNVEADDTADNSTVVLHTVTSGTTLKITSIWFSAINNSGGDAYGYMVVRNASDVEQYKLIFITLPNGGYHSESVSFSNPVNVDENFDIAIISSAADFEVFGGVFGIEA